MFKLYWGSFCLYKYDFLKSVLTMLGKISRKMEAHQHSINLIWSNTANYQKVDNKYTLLLGWLVLSDTRSIFWDNIKPLRKLCKWHFWQPIPEPSWTPQFITLFEELKEGVISSPVFYLFDTNKKKFWRPEWSAKIMGCLLMQPSDDKESHQDEK